ncbi:MAG: response regulator [Polyangiales bacterium]
MMANVPLGRENLTLAMDQCAHAHPCPRAFVVDDDGAVGTLVGQVLTAIGFAVARSESGREALERIGRGERFDLVVSDVEMPGMDGPAFLMAARAVWPEIDAVLVFVTGGYGASLSKSTALRFTKPLKAEFYAHASDIFERRRPSPPR